MCANFVIMATRACIGSCRIPPELHDFWGFAFSPQTVRGVVARNGATGPSRARGGAPLSGRQLRARRK